MNVCLGIFVIYYLIGFLYVAAVRGLPLGQWWGYIIFPFIWPLLMLGGSQ